MTTLIHVVGESDLGFDTTPGHAAPLTPGARRDRLNDWAQDVHDAIEGSDRTRLLGLLTGDATDRTRPLVTALTKLAAMGTRVDALILIANDDPGSAIATMPIARGIQNGIESGVCGFGVGMQVRLVSGGLTDDDGIRGRVKAAVLESANPLGEHCYLTWGQGSTAIALAAMAGALAATTTLTLLPTKAGLTEDLFSLDLGGRSPVHAWMGRFGFPEEVIDYKPPPPWARVLTTLMREGNDGSTLPGLATLVAADIRRNDGTSGFALRLLIQRLYEDMLAADVPLAGTAYPNLLDAAKEVLKSHFGPNHRITLGEQLSVISESGYRCNGGHTGEPVCLRLPTAAEASANQPSGQWLRRTIAVHTDATASVHDFRPLEPETVYTVIDRATPIIPTALHSALAAPCFSAPTGRLGVIVGAGTDIGRGPVAAALQIPLGQELSAVFPSGGLRETTSLILCTEDPRSHKKAAQEAEAAQSHGHSATRQIKNLSLECAEAATKEWLTGVSVDAILILPSGPKELLAGAIMASRRYAAERAIPVFVQILAQPALGDNAAPRATYHRVMAQTQFDHMLIKTALKAWKSLYLDTAIRLVTMSTGYTDLSADMSEFRADFFSADLSGLGGRLKICLKLLQAGNVARYQITRLISISHTQIERCLKKHIQEAKAGTCGASHSCNDVKTHLLAALGSTGSIRNDLPLFHGDTPAKRDRARGALRNACAQVDCYSQPPSHPDRFDKIARALQATEKEAHSLGGGARYWP